MRNIDQEKGIFLFGRIEEIIGKQGLTFKEYIPRFRALLEELFKILVSDEKQYVTGLFKMNCYIFKEYLIPPHIVSQVHGLRKYANEVAHKSEIVPGEMEYLRCLYQLCLAVSYFSGLEIPDTFSRLYRPYLKQFESESTSKVVVKEVYDFYAIIEKIEVSEENCCVLLCNTDDLGQVRLRLMNTKNERGWGSDLSGFTKIARPYQSIYMAGVQKSRNGEYYTTENSLIVLEPDYVIDAKELAECRQYSSRTIQRYEDNPLLYLLHQFSQSEITDRMMIGYIVGKMLDDMITGDGTYEYGKSFETVMRENAFGMLCVAHEDGKYVRENIRKLYTEAKGHETTLRLVVQYYKSDNNNRLIVEPTFISNKYGLLGRLDLLVEYGKTDRKDIVELKSSKKYPQPHIGLYSNHEAQTLCYDLLISSTYPKRRGISSILYSSIPVGEPPLRYIGDEKYISKQELLMLRNQIVANEQLLAEGDFRPFEQIISGDFGACPPFLEQQLEHLRKSVYGLDPILKAYFLGYLKFIYRELQVAKIGGGDVYSKSNGFAALWKASQTEKIDNYDILINLEVRTVSDDFVLELTYDRTLFSSVCSLRSGDIGIIYPTPNKDELNPLSTQILKCRILTILDNQVKISLVNKQLNKDFFKQSRYWVLEKDFRDSGYRQLLQSVFSFISADSGVKGLVLGLKKPGFDSEPELDCSGLDEAQRNNVKKALAAKNYYLIQGPPGTGKTSKVLVEIVRNLALRDTDTMVLAFTNRAVDEICYRMEELGVDCIRLGRGEQSYCWSALAQTLKLNDLNDRMESCKIFVSTLSTFSMSLDLLKFKKFETLILDEASQVLEPQIVGVLKYFRCWILIGDENQLPAVVIQSERSCKCVCKELNEISLTNFGESLFYRLKRNALQKGWEECIGLLSSHYRMHVDIARFPTDYFYGGRLHEGLALQREPFTLYSHIRDEYWRGWLNKRFIFVPTKPDFRSKINDDEALWIAKLLQFIAEAKGDHFNPLKTVGVITPFRAQIANIRGRLEGIFREVTVDTVERFQGSERDIIIVSMAVKDRLQLGAIEAFNEEGVDRKLNVTLTRAKEQVILLGTEKILNESKLYRELITTIKRDGGYRSE